MMFWSGTSSMEDDLLSRCQSKTNTYHPGTTWKEQCDFGGLVEALNTFPGQIWLEGVTNDLTHALQGILSGITMSPLLNDGSPVIVPLYGHPTHWGTIYRVALYNAPENNDYLKIAYLEWFDSGKAGLKDGQLQFYSDGYQGSDPATFVKTFYPVVHAPYLSSSDKYINNYLYSYDPPAGSSLQSEQRRIADIGPISYGRMPGVLRAGEEMSRR